MQEFPNGIPFLKMHGAGNDFVVIDNRSGAVALDKTNLQLLANRRYGVGCDQIVLLEKSSVADVFMRLYNCDGGEVFACGNATRCVAWLIMGETGKPHVKVETKADVLSCDSADDMAVTVNMGTPRFDWQSIPLARKVDTFNIPFIRIGALHEGFALSMGNPHIVFESNDVDKAPLEDAGPRIENHELFPERINVEIMQVVARDHLKVRVWERGVGETLACGTGACAAMVAAWMRGLVDNKATVSLPGGDLIIEFSGEQKAENAWHGNDVLMTGPVALVAKGEWMQP
ncbi:MAG: diaminopimelate epimerase [Alphaproteobacteria bacterium]|nr:diaminopimelate epimerase [Alphaproteobacteria bacterium]